MNKIEINRNNILTLISGVLLLLVAVFGIMDDYGAGVLNYTYSILVHSFIDYIILVFAVSLLLTLFAASGWVKGLLTSI